MEEKKVFQIGPSIGYLFTQGMYDLQKHQEFLDEAGANAAELVMYFKEEKRQEAMLSKRLNTDFVSIHLEDFYPDGSLYRQVFVSKQIFDKQQAKIGVLHTANVKDFYLEALTEIGINVAIENMDATRPSGHARWELEDLLKKFKLKFVLDIQHAFKHDSSMVYAWDLFQMAGANLVFLHVSGQNSASIHSLVHKADNKKSITEFVGKIFSQIQVPIILEGYYVAAPEIKKEIDFLKKELGF